MTSADYPVLSEVLPNELVRYIIYDCGGLRTPTARIIRDRINEWEEHKIDMDDLMDRAHIKVDEYFFFDWVYFAMNYEKSIYKVLFIY
tara:strand:+ start:94 stop:357 length:264 start_codon:yes stop_codon:yes gene_type:complete